MRALRSKIISVNKGRFMKNNLNNDNNNNDNYTF